MKQMEVLVATMNQNIEDLALANKMNLQTDAIIINQAGRVHYAESLSEERHIQMYSFNERGVGLSRNSALMRSKATICLMADDDMVYVDGYEKIVSDAYDKYPDADFIVFNVRIHYNDRIEERVKKEGKVSYFNSLKYGTVTFSFKRDSILKKNMSFSLLFGGGTNHGSGEDTLFLWTALKKGLKVYAIPDIIADVYNYESSWFEGYTDKFYYDKGALFKALEPRFYPLLNLQFAIRKRKAYGTTKSVLDIYRLMNKGSQSMNE